MSTTTIKLQFNDDIRRIPVEKDKISYQDLLTRIAAIYKTITVGELNRIVVKYLDNESDMCTVSTDEELQEAFCSFPTTNQVLKLVISIQEEKCEKPAREWKWKEHGKGLCQFRKLCRDGITLMEESKFEAAREIFLAQLKEAKTEWQQRIPCYLVACCEASLGNSAQALEYIEKAVNFGLRNLRKLKEDPLLESIRSLEKFQQLVTIVAERKEARKSDEFRAECRKKFTEEWKNKHPNFTGNCGEGFPRKCHWRKFLKNNNTPSASEQPIEKSPVLEIVKEEEKKEENVPLIIEKSEEKPSLVVPHQYEKTLAVFEEMGFMNRDQNIEALNQVNGDAKLAISVILGL
jgi:hypothetical protein